MKILLGLITSGLVIAGVGTAYRDDVLSYWKERTRPRFFYAEMSRGDIVSIINSTGTVHPVKSVLVGTFVSGPIQEILVDFNDSVKEGQVLAKVDERIYDANVERDEAILQTRKAEVERVNALLQQAINEEKRAQKRRDARKGSISDTEFDEKKFKKLSLVAEQKLAQASVKEALANLNNSQANLNYTVIRSPVDGIVIERAVDTGQVVAASFQTPKLFVVAPDLDKRVYVHALVDEADIGMIRGGQERGLPVNFTVDAYPDELFEGALHQIRMASTETQNVVTYPVVLSSPNPELKLMPGMTANISFRVDEHKDVIRIPNAALRFYPNPQHVHPEDRNILVGLDVSLENPNSGQDIASSADERVKASLERNRRHVWIVDGEFLRAIPVTTGLSNGQYTELISGEIEEQQRLVTGVKS